jgi:hypothetical protein
MESDAEKIEQLAGCTWNAFVTELRRGASKARRALLWHLMHLAHPELRVTEVPDFRRRDLLVEFDAADLTVLRAEYLETPEQPGVDRAAVLAKLDEEIAEATAKWGPAAGKAVSEPSGSATAG